MLRWSPNGTDEQILASVIDLVEQMAHQTGRHLKWSRDESEVQMDTHHAPQVALQTGKCSFFHALIMARHPPVDVGEKLPVR